MRLKLFFIIALLTCVITGFGQMPPQQKDHSFNANDFKTPRKIFFSISISEEKNYLFRTPALDSSLMDILLTGINTGAIVAYESDTASLALTPQQVRSLLSSDTNNNNAIVTSDAMTKLYMKEEWTFQRDKGRLLARITNIAPVIKMMDTTGIIREQPAFWFRYSDIRPFFALHKVTTNHTEKDKINNLLDVFDGRHYTSEVIKQLK